MRGVVLREFGAAEVLRLEELPTPRAEAGWVTVELHASALNWHDVLVRQGRYGSPLPHVLGADGAGRRTDTGKDVIALPSLWWGDMESAPGPAFEILGDRRWGTYAEIACLRHGGRVIVLGASRAESVAIEPRPFYFGQYELIGTTMGSPRDFGGLLDLVATHSVSPPPVARVFPLDAAAAAHQYLEQGDGFGKVVLTQS